MMKKIRSIYYIICVALGLVMASCVDDDSFSTSTSDVLAFSTDTVSLDTTFSNVPTPTRSLWVYNRSNKGIRCQLVRLESGNQTGFRVNVDGTYLGQSSGFQTQDVEIRKGDSIRVFVELTSKQQGEDGPQLVEDNLIFALESGVQQKVNLKAYSWDAELLKDGLTVKRGETMMLPADGTSKPIVVYGGIKVDTAAVLNILPGTTLYFHENAGLQVYGTLHSKGEKGKEIVLRGDRIDHMFDYLPYDRTPGRWQGIRLRSSSVGNVISFTDIHSPYNGILVDSCHNEAYNKESKLVLSSSTVHNCQGYGVKVDSAAIVTIENCQISNTLDNCLYVHGAQVKVNQATLAQFYPFSSLRKEAFKFVAPDTLRVTNSLITGYADDEVSGVRIENEPFRFSFDHCVLRTEKPNTDDSLRFTHVLYEHVKEDSIKQGEGETATYLHVGKGHFVKFDTNNLVYDFHLRSVSAAVGVADPSTTTREDRDGNERNLEKPDAGCYQHQEKQEEEKKE